LLQIQLNEELPSNPDEKTAENDGITFSKIVSLAAHVDSHTGKGLPPFKRPFTQGDNAIQWVSQVPIFSVESADRDNWYRALAEELAHLAPIDPGSFSFWDLLGYIGSENLSKLMQLDLPWKKKNANSSSSKTMVAQINPARHGISKIMVTITQTEGQPEDQLYVYLTLQGEDDKLTHIGKLASWLKPVPESGNGQIQIPQLYHYVGPRCSNWCASEALVGRLLDVIAGKEIPKTETTHESSTADSSGKPADESTTEPSPEGNQPKHAA